MLPFSDPAARAHARALRRNPTDAEARLWRQVRCNQMHGLRFRRQAPIGPYIVDFVCLPARLVIELDGGQHSEAAGYDELRSSYLGRAGFRVLRFWNGDVLQKTEDVLDTIWWAVEERMKDRPTRSQPSSRQ